MHEASIPSQHAKKRIENAENAKNQRCIRALGYPEQEALAQRLQFPPKTLKISVFDAQ